MSPSGADAAAFRSPPSHSQAPAIVSRQSLSPVTVHHTHHRSQSSLAIYQSATTATAGSSLSDSDASMTSNTHVPSPLTVSPKSANTNTTYSPTSPSPRTNAMSITSTYPSNFDSIYYIDHSVILGEGYSSVVKVCYRRQKPLNINSEASKENAESDIFEDADNEENIDFSVAYACKVMDKTNANLDTVKWREEVFVLQHFNHPHIIRLYDVFENKTTIYLVFECAKGGELFDRICKEKKFTETNVRKIVSSILRAIEYLHDRGIVHRDIKPENIFFCIEKIPKNDNDSKALTNDSSTFPKITPSRSFSTSLPNNLHTIQTPADNVTPLQSAATPLPPTITTSSSSDKPVKPPSPQTQPYHRVEVVKLGDFGLARNLLTKPRALRAKSHVGTLGYAAPEIFSGEGYNEKCDMWSVGVITYILLSGVAPFVPDDAFANYAESDPFWIYVNRMMVNKQSILKFPEGFFRDISDGAKNFVSCLLEINPSRRLRASEALRHPWLLKGKNSKTVLKPSQRTWTVADSQHLNMVSATTPTSAASHGNTDDNASGSASTQNSNTLSPTRRFSRLPVMPSMPEEAEDD